MSRTWQTSQPPNEVWVEVEDGGEIIEVQAFYGRDGYRPHWKTRDGGAIEPAAFRRWRFRPDDCAECGGTKTSGERAKDGAPLVCAACQGGRRP